MRFLGAMIQQDLLVSSCTKCFIQAIIERCVYRQENLSPFLYWSSPDGPLHISGTTRAFYCAFATIVASHVQPEPPGLGG